MSVPAQRSKLANLHSKLAEVLTEALETVGTSSTISDETGLEVTTPAALSSEDLGVMRLTAAFLKDNDITCDDDQGDTRNEQLEKLNELRKVRTVASTPMDELH